MESKILFRAIIVGIVAFVLVTGVAVHRLLKAGGPPSAGTMTNFKPAASPVPVPKLAFTDEAGTPVDLAAYKGKLVLLNVWATWCAPCVEELPSIARLRQARENDHFAVVTVSEDRGGKVAVDKFFHDHQMDPLPHDLDPEANLSRVLGLAGLPTTLLIDSAGREIGRLELGADWDGEDAQKLIDYYLAHDPAAVTTGKG